MPDADDFDVEYFRSLLKGNSPKEPAAAPPSARKRGKTAAAPAAAGKKATPASTGKRGGKRP